MEVAVVTAWLLVPVGDGVAKTGNARTPLAALGARVDGGVEKPGVVARVALPAEATVSLTDKVTWIASIPVTVLAIVYAFP
jgi:hypothetical protein